MPSRQADKTQGSQADTQSYKQCEKDTHPPVSDSHQAVNQVPHRALPGDQIQPDSHPSLGQSIAWLFSQYEFSGNQTN